MTKREIWNAIKADQMKTQKYLQEYQPKTGLPCHCRKGIQRDNCPTCEGTGLQIDFARLRQAKETL